MTDPQPRNILVMILGQLGDVVLALPALSAIRKQFSHSKISVLAAASTCELLELSELADEIIPVDRRALRNGSIHGTIWQLFRLVRQVRRRRFDLVIDLHSLYETNILGFLSGAPQRLFANRENRSIDILSNIRPRPPKEDKSLHKSTYYLNVLEPLGIKEGGSFRLQPPNAELPNELSNAIDSAEAGAKVGVFIGAGHPGRKWPLERFASLADRLIHRDEARVFIILGPEEADQLDEVKKLFESSIVIVIGLSLRQLLSFVSKVDLFVGNDTGPSHLASIIGTPTIMIMRSDYDRRFTPLGDNTVYVASGPVSAITVDEAYVAARQVLSHGKTQKQEEPEKDHQ